MNKNGSCIFSLTATHAPSLFLSLILILSLIFLPAEYVGGQVGVVVEEDPTQVTIQQPSELPRRNQTSDQPIGLPRKTSMRFMRSLCLGPMAGCASCPGTPAGDSSLKA